MEEAVPRQPGRVKKPWGFKRLRNLFLFVSFQLLFALLLLEVIARVFDPLGISYYPETARFFDTMVHEEPISYRLKQGLDGQFHHARYQVNSIGLRGPEIAVPKPEGESRILWLGDSIVFGLGVGNDQTMPAVVEHLANQPGPKQHYQVVNMGVPSYNTEQELIQFETVGLPLQPDAVLLMFATNDIERKGWVFDRRQSWISNFSQRSYALSTLFILSRLARQGTGTDAPVINMQNYTEDNPRWRAIADSLARINQICNSKSIPFVVMVMGSVDDTPNNMVAAEGRKDGFEVFGLQPGLDSRWPDASSPRYRNSAVDSHCNAAGCEMWAQLVYEHLAGRGIVNAAP